MRIKWASAPVYASVTFANVASTHVGEMPDAHSFFSFCYIPSPWVHFLWLWSTSYTQEKITSTKCLEMRPDWLMLVDLVHETQQLGSAWAGSDLVIKTLVKIPTPPTGGPGFSTWLCSDFSFLLICHPGRQQQWIIAIHMEAWTELLAPSFSCTLGLL